MRRILILFPILLSASGYDFLNIPFSSKEAVLYEASGLFETSPAALFQNPSSIYLVKETSVETGYGKYILDMRQGFISFVHSRKIEDTLPERGGAEERTTSIQPKIGISLFFLHTGEFTKTDTFGNILGTYTAPSMGAYVVLPLPFFKEWHSSSAIEFLYQGIDKYKSIAGAISLGFSGEIPDFFKGNPLKWGLALKHIGYEIKPFDGKRTNLPLSLTFSSGIKYESGFLGISPSYVLGEGFGVSIGTYYKIKESLRFAVGYTTRNNGTKVESNLKTLITGFSFGFDIKIKKAGLFYGYTPFGVFGDLHRFDISFAF